MTRYGTNKTNPLIFKRLIKDLILTHNLEKKVGEKFRRRLDGSVRHHIYYHCTLQVKYDCDERYISEGELINQLLRYIKQLNFSNIPISEKLQGMYLDFKKVSREILLQKEIDTNDGDIDFKNYEIYVLREGSNR